MRKVFLDDLPRERYRGRSCIKWADSIGYIVKFIYDNIEGEIEIISYDREKQCLEVKYLDNPPFNIYIGNFTKCCIGRLLNRYTNEFKIEIGRVFKDDNRNITITDREYRLTYRNNGTLRTNWRWYKYTCNKCGWTEGWIAENHLIKGVGCGCCCPTPRSVVLGINTIWDTDKWLIPIINNDEFCKTHSHGCGDKVYPTCTDCGEISKTPVRVSSIYGYKKMTCKCCSDGISYPNKLMFNILTQLELDFIPEYSPEWVGRKFYDFYVPSMKLIIEMDGGFHNKDNKMSGQTKEESKHIDGEKDSLARDNGDKVIRINCEKSELEFIKQSILDNKLDELFDLSIIIWNKCEEFALSNRVKEACDLWNSGIHNAKEIAKTMKLDRTTITPYLKRGQLLGWCEYDAKEEMAKSGRRNGGVNKKPIICVENGKTFESANDCARRSKEVFGTKLYSPNIGSVCRGERPHHKGYTFKYINEIEQAI